MTSRSKFVIQFGSKVWQQSMENVITVNSENMITVNSDPFSYHLLAAPQNCQTCKYGWEIIALPIVINTSIFQTINFFIRKIKINRSCS